MTSQNNKNKTTSLPCPLTKDQDWGAGRKREAVMRILRVSVEILSRKLSIEIKRLAQLHAKALAANNSTPPQDPARPRGLCIQGQARRKVWTRLRVRDGVWVSRKWVLRIVEVSW